MGWRDRGEHNAGYGGGPVGGERDGDGIELGAGGAHIVVDQDATAGDAAGVGDDQGAGDRSGDMAAGGPVGPMERGVGRAFTSVGATALSMGQRPAMSATEAAWRTSSVCRIGRVGWVGLATIRSMSPGV